MNINNNTEANKMDESVNNSIGQLMGQQMELLASNFSKDQKIKELENKLEQEKKNNLPTLTLINNGGGLSG